MESERRDHKIYKYTNKVNGKVYIGRTCTSLYKRARGGEGYRGCVYFWNAIQKYGWENFEGEILEEGLTAEESSVKEIEYIEKYNSANGDFGYNIVKSAQSDFDDTRRLKISERNKGENNPRWGCHISEEHRRKIIETNKKRVYTPEMRRNLSEARKKSYAEGTVHPMSGHKHTQEAKDKMSKANKGHIPWNKGKKMSEVSPDYVPSFLGKHHSEEARRKISEANKGRSNTACSKRVVCIETGVIYDSALEASRIIKRDVSQLCKCCRGVRKSCGGYHWCYVDDLPKN